MTAMTLLFADVVDSTGVASALGDLRMAELSSRHDAVARDLLREWRGREIDKSDGMLLLFEDVAPAVGWALEYQRRLRVHDLPFDVRIGIHHGDVLIRPNRESDIALGAKPLEVDGLAKPIAARIMAVAGGAQILLSHDAFRRIDQLAGQSISHGHWRLKGLAEPIEIFEVADQNRNFVPPLDGPKGYRVVSRGSVWMPARDVKHNLPAEPDRFVGRADDLQTLILAMRHHRQLTLVGVGGVGKTRLATNFARAWLGDFPGGVAFCDLANARTLDGMMLAVAEALGVTLGKTDPAAQLGSAITSRGECLIILDNFEQITRLARQTVIDWLDMTDQSHFLVTSREVLGIRGERVLSLATLSAVAARELFCDRAKAAKSDFICDESGERAIQRLVKLLDCLPLAIELAAARVRVIEPVAMLDRMHERFRLLSYGPDRADRQGTLRATLDWSWDLLSQTEQTALAQLSVFVGGFTLEAAEAIIALPLAEPMTWLLDVMQALVEKSLLRKSGSDRFEMLESVREYAAERLVSHNSALDICAAPDDAVERRHGLYFSAARGGGRESAALHDLENTVAACARAARRGDGEVAVGALITAWRALKLRGPFRAGAELSETVSAMEGLSVVQSAVARRILGNAMQACGFTVRSRIVLEEALVLAEASHDPSLIVLALDRLAEAHLYEGNMEVALELYERAEASLTEPGDPAVACAVLSGMGTCHEYLGNVARAEELYQSALSRARRAGARRWEGGALGNLGQWNANQGRKDEALRHYRSALTIAQELNDRPWEGNVRCNLGLLHLGLSDFGNAQQELELALGVARELGYRRLESVVVCNLGLAMQAQGDPVAAREKFERAVEIARALSDRRSEGQFLGYLGYLRGLGQELAEARDCLSRGAELLRTVGDKTSLGLLLSQFVQVEALSGAAEQAAAILNQAEQLAADTRPAPDSEFGIALDLARARSTSTLSSSSK